MEPIFFLYWALSGVVITWGTFFIRYVTGTHKSNLRFYDYFISTVTGMVAGPFCLPICIKIEMDRRANKE